MTPEPGPETRISGCFLGGAVADALGAPVEFLSTAQIRAAFGAAGIQEFAPAYGRRGAITDDTQMTLFMAEGLIRAHVRYTERGICHPPVVIHRALMRWLDTQGEQGAASPSKLDGWLIEEKRLFSRRAPGATCLSALRASTQLGEDARNDSKGCGAIMRIAPVGLVATMRSGESEGPPRVYTLACESAKTTHGHRESTLSSGFFALVVANLMGGASLTEAISASVLVLEREPEADYVISMIERAVSAGSSDAPSTPELVESLGAGWVAEEALAISLFCALRAENFEHGVRLAVNHGGDSDSTGSLTGQLLGTLWGASLIPQRWLDDLELRDVIETLAADLFAVQSGATSIDVDRYPGW